MTRKEKNTTSFNNLGINKNILNVLTKKGFKSPTPIQHQIIPGALEGKDVVGVAQTGTGKTLAFVIPMIQNLSSGNERGLILTPTRELALQIEQVFRDIGGSSGLKTTVIIGGIPQYKQVKSLKNNPDIIIATPGRLDDLLNQKKLTLDRISIVTLDEADRMLDIGFLPQIKKVLKLITKKRQTMLFSATMPNSISSLASEFMRMPLRIEIAPQGTAAKNVEQEVFIIEKNNKTRLLDSILKEHKDDTVLVFSRTRHGAKRIARDVRNMGHTATEIHSDRTQSQRKSSLDGFIRGKYRVMVATDIASRGIDVKDIALVINFDLPDNSGDYVHRIGRTGRAGLFGRAVSFVTSAQKRDVKKIEKLIRKSLPILSLPTLPPERKKPAYSDKPHRSSRRFNSKKRSYKDKKKGKGKRKGKGKGKGKGKEDRTSWSYGKRPR
ncbi:MAG: DEAD/DEAH box helicase [Candidatus Paceibacterota bacterium]